MSGLLTKPLALVLAALLLVVAGAGLGAWLAARHYRPQLDAAAEGLTACRSARGNLEALVADQNSAIAGLANAAEQRQAKAVQEVQRAQPAAAMEFSAGQRLQQERTGGDPAAASVSIIDQELGL
ncbi:hypothetical protein [Pseudomonas citronellolis]|jgi:hypothetical protein|uniref:hypothetical protein n=1 Tax=Pseudomonas citronellolis TaxID=53408 RepID=UPI00389A29AD